jgi:hypothetical protein
MDNRTEAMSVETSDTQVLTRIGFAEGWLHRAKAQCADGDVPGGLLTLSLADAEVRFALEAGGWPQARGIVRSQPSRRWIPWLLLAAAAAVASAWTFRPAAVPADAGIVDGPPVVRFSSTIGAVLSAVSVPSAPPASVQVSRPDVHPRVQRAVTRPAPRPAAAPRPRVEAAPAVRAATTAVRTTTAGTPSVLTTPAPAAAPPPSPVTPFVLSEVDLIDMVLAANQALRGTGP